MAEFHASHTSAADMRGHAPPVPDVPGQPRAWWRRSRPRVARAPWRRSIRVRHTLIAAVVSLLTFALLGAGATPILRDIVREHHCLQVQSAARRVAISLREGRLPTPIPPDPGGAGVLQVMHADGRIFNGAGPTGTRPLSSAHPSADEQFRDVMECRPGQRCQLVRAIRVALPQKRDVLYVYAAKDAPVILMPAVLELLIATFVVVLTGCTSTITWKIVGRTLAPVEAIRAQLAEISATGLSRRVPEPPGDDEIARMARTANQTLDRLQALIERQRQFTADASHELRTPVAGVLANLEYALMYPEDTDVPATLTAVLRDTERIEAIITDLLLLAQLDTGSNAAHTRIDLAELVNTQLRQRRSDIRTNLASGVVVTGVRAQLMRLLSSLLDNAERHAHSVIKVEVHSDADGAQLVITDDGCGIPEADRERVFARFTRLDTARSRDTGGTGLGLPIARGIAHAHGGSLRITDSQRGTRFVLYLPLYPPEIHPEPLIHDKW